MQLAWPCPMETVLCWLCGSSGVLGMQSSHQLLVLLGNVFLHRSRQCWACSATASLWCCQVECFCVDPAGFTKWSAACDCSLWVEGQGSTSTGDIARFIAFCWAQRCSPAVLSSFGCGYLLCSAVFCPVLASDAVASPGCVLFCALTWGCDVSWADTSSFLLRLPLVPVMPCCKDWLLVCCMHSGADLMQASLMELTQCGRWPAEEVCTAKCSSHLFTGRGWCMVMSAGCLWPYVLSCLLLGLYLLAVCCYMYRFVCCRLPASCTSRFSHTCLWLFCMWMVWEAHISCSCDHLCSGWGQVRSLDVTPYGRVLRVFWPVSTCSGF
jgi:hypothetical protein